MCLFTLGFDICQPITGFAVQLVSNVWIYGNPPTPRQSQPIRDWYNVRDSLFVCSFVLLFLTGVASCWYSNYFLTKQSQYLSTLMDWTESWNCCQQTDRMWNYPEVSVTSTVIGSWVLCQQDSQSVYRDAKVSLFPDTQGTKFEFGSFYFWTNVMLKPLLVQWECFSPLLPFWDIPLLLSLLLLFPW